MHEAVTGAEAAVALQNALDLSVGHEAMTYAEEVPQWAATSLAVMAENGLVLNAEAELTRGEVAQMLYQVSRMAIGAPGMMVFNMQDKKYPPTIRLGGVCYLSKSVPAK